MCDECRNIPHHHRCPNRPESKIVGSCIHCSGTIREDYEQWKDNDNNMFCCSDCATDYHGIREIDYEY